MTDSQKLLIMVNPELSVGYRFADNDNNGFFSEGS